MRTAIIDDPLEAGRLVRAGRLVAFPTETVYGLGANGLSTEAVGRIFEAKGRPADNPLILHVADEEGLLELTSELSEQAMRLFRAFCPGPLTLVVPRGPRVPDIVSAGLPTVGVRLPAHPLAQALLQAAAVPVAAPSANRSGRPSPTTWEAVRQDLDGRIDAILRGSRAPVGLESTVVDCTGPEPVILRAGAVTLSSLRTVCPGARMADTDDERTARSPGTRHPHYRPIAEVHLVERPGAGGADRAFIGVSDPVQNYALRYVARDVDDYAWALYDFFRRADAAGARIIECERVSDSGVGRALMDRLRRACSG